MINKLIYKSFLNEEKEFANLNKTILQKRTIEKPCNLIHFGC